MNQQTLTSGTGRALPATWSNLVTRGFDPGPAWRRRVIVTGFPGTGKSTFVASIPNAIILDFEDSQRDVQNPAAYRFGPRITNQGLASPPTTEYQNVLERLIQEGKSNNRTFDIVVWDTIDAFLDRLIEAFCLAKQVKTIGEWGQKGAGYNQVYTQLFDYYDRLTQAGYGLWVCTHLETKPVVVGKETQDITGLSINPGVLRELSKRAEYLFYTKISQIQEVEKKIVDLPGGEKKEVEAPTNRWRKTYSITVETPSRNQRELSKVRIPLSAEIAVGLTGGYQQYAEEFDRSVAQINNSIHSNK